MRFEPAVQERRFILRQRGVCTQRRRPPLIENSSLFTNPNCFYKVNGRICAETNTSQHSAKMGLFFQMEIFLKSTPYSGDLLSMITRRQVGEKVESG